MNFVLNEMYQNKHYWKKKKNGKWEFNWAIIKFGNQMRSTQSTCINIPDGYVLVVAKWNNKNSTWVASRAALSRQIIEYLYLFWIKFHVSCSVDYGSLLTARGKNMVTQSDCGGGGGGGGF